MNDVDTQRHIIADAVANARLSVLAELAVNDAKRVNRSKFKPNSGYWLKDGPKGTCLGCLAGVVIFTSLEITDSDNLNKADEDPNVVSMQVALDSLRTGRIGNAYEDLKDSGARETFPFNEPYPVHDDFTNWTEFDKHVDYMETLIPKMKAYEAARDGA